MIIFGTCRSDHITGTDRRDLIITGRGNDEIQAGGGNDLVFAGRGSDSVQGGDGCDLIFGGRGSDTIDGGAGSDVLFGGRGSDRFVHVVSASNEGDRDYYDGGRGRDTLELVLTQAEADNLALTAEIEAFEDWLAAGGRGSFRFDTLNLVVRDLERLVVTIVDGGNAAPDVTPLEGELGEDAAAMDFDLLAGASDADGDVLSVQGLPSQITTREGRVLQAGTDYDLTNGALGLTDAGLAKFNDLGEGQTDQVVFSFEVSDGTVATANTFTLTITGANDAASIAGDTAGAVAEDGVLSATGTLTVTDADQGEDTVIAQAGTAGAYGTFAITEAGAWTYTLDNASPVVQELAQNQSVTESFAVLSADGTATETVEITIAGENDDPTVGASLVLTATEDGALQSIDLLATASDVDQDDVLSIENISALPAGFELEGTTLTVDPGDSVFQSLAQGGSITAAITYDVVDGKGGIVAQSLEVTVTGANDDPTVGAGLTLTATEDGAAQSIDLVSGASDIDTGDVLAVANLTGLPDGFVLDGSTLTVDPASDAFQSLGQDESLTASVTYDVTDGNGGSAAQVLDLTVTGVNDDPTVASALTITATEDGSVENIDLLAGASDVDANDVLSIANVSTLPAGIVLEGSTLTLDPTDAAYQSLGADASITATVTYDVTDGNGGNAPQVLEIVVNGANDDPVVGAGLTLTATEDGAAQSIDLLSGASDVDAGDSLLIADVSMLPDGISLNGTTLTVDPTDPAFDALGSDDTAEFTIDYSVVDLSGGSTAQSVTVTVEGIDNAQPPATPTLEIARADQSAPDATEAARVTLLGETSPNAIVELQSADGSQVLASALADNTGEFRLPDVALDLGTTDFRIVARDPETGLESTAGTASFERVEPAPGADANAVLFWIDIALETIADAATGPDYASRALAMQSIAVQNVLAAVDGSDGYPFSFEGAEADPDLAVAYAAHGVLKGLFAGQSAPLDAALDAFVAANTAGSGTGPIDITAQVAAQALGEAASAQILDVRAEDGFDDEVVFIGENTDGQWRPNGPAYLNAQNPQWADLETFALASDDQFRPDAPPSLLGDTITDDAYANDLERVRALGEAESTDRTDDQTQIARFWADGAGTETPPGHWNRIAAQVSEAEGLSLRHLPFKTNSFEGLRLLITLSF